MIPASVVLLTLLAGAPASPDRPFAAPAAALVKDVLGKSPAAPVGLVWRGDAAPLLREVDVALELAAAATNVPWTRVMATHDAEAARVASARGIATLLDVTAWRVGETLQVNALARDTRPNLFSGKDLPARPPLFEVRARWPLDATMRALEGCGAPSSGPAAAVKLASIDEEPSALAIAFPREPTEPLLMVAGTQTLRGFTLQGGPPVVTVELPRNRSDTPSRAPFTRLFAAPRGVDLVDGRNATTSRWTLADGFTVAPADGPQPVAGKSLWRTRTDAGVVELQRSSELDTMAFVVGADAVAQLKPRVGAPRSLGVFRGEAALALAADGTPLFFFATPRASGGASWRVVKAPDDASSSWSIAGAPALASGELQSGTVVDAQTLVQGDTRAVFILVSTGTGAGDLYRLELP